MRLHHNLVVGVAAALEEIFTTGAYASKVIERTLKKNPRWGSRDRGFIANAVYSIVRYKRLYGEIASVSSDYRPEEIWRMISVWLVLSDIEVPDWAEFKGTPVRRIRGMYDELKEQRVLRESIPDWLDELGMEHLPDIWEQELHALNQEAPVVLRTNRLKSGVKDLQHRLKEDGIDTATIKGYPDALQLITRANVFRTDAFKKGHFEVQDASSQLVAPFTKAQPGQRVVDSCAGAGGKTLHLAAQMQNKGILIAMDKYGWKLKETKLRARRAGAHNVETREITSTKVLKKMNNQADVVLIDAPCTGLGVLRRNPDTKWKLQPEHLDSLVRTQQMLLQSHSRMVKPGGTLVYATCSILPMENKMQVEAFLDSKIGKGFKLEEQRSQFVHRSGHDGFYMARMKRVIAETPSPVKPEAAAQTEEE